jgi:hypothetical protein
MIFLEISPNKSLPNHYCVEIFRLQFIIYTSEELFLDNFTF